MLQWLILILVASTLLISSSSEMDTLKEELLRTYLEVVNLSKEGGEVKGVIDILNELLDLMRSGNLNEESLMKYLSKAKNLISLERERALEAKRWFYVKLLIFAIIAIVTIIFGYKRVISLYYLFKRWYLSQYAIQISRRRREVKVIKSSLFSGEVTAVILAILIVASVFSISYLMLRGRVVEPFCELGTLGPKKKIGGYPREVVVGEPIRLWIYVGNHLGYPAYFRVLIKLGNRSTSMSESGFKAPLILYRERILAHNDTWLFPIEVRISSPGINYRIIVELWAYNFTTKSFTFTGRWNQIWVNVTRPSIP